MARIQPDEDFDLIAVVDRLVAAARKNNPEVTNHSRFAVEMGLTAQAFSNIGKRQSMSLSFLIKACKRFGLSLDYAVWGRDEIGDDYINIPRVGGGYVKFPAELIRVREAQHMRADIEDGQLYIIYIADKVLRTGMYAFGDPERPIYRGCQARIDGSVLVAGEAEADVAALNIVGRVLWFGEAP